MQMTRRPMSIQAEKRQQMEMQHLWRIARVPRPFIPVFPARAG